MHTSPLASTTVNLGQHYQTLIDAATRCHHDEDPFPFRDKAALIKNMTKYGDRRRLSKRHKKAQVLALDYVPALGARKRGAS
jgi:hypothetical protein